MTSEEQELLTAAVTTLASALQEGFELLADKLGQVEEQLDFIGERLEGVEKHLKEIDSSILDRGL